jgi:hypothetical protein
MITRAKQLRDMASECRSNAEITKNPEARRRLLEVAGSLERLAGQHEATERRKPDRLKEGDND